VESELSVEVTALDDRTSHMVRVTGFTGPIEDLVQRAHRGEVDLRDVALADVVRDYLETLRDGVDLDRATEFLWNAAALVEMKSKLLLPPKPEPDSIQAADEQSHLTADLEAQVEEYRAFKEAAAALAELEAVQRNIFTRLPSGTPPDDLPLVGVTVADLFTAFRRVLERSRDTVNEIPPEGVTVAERMRHILRALAASAGEMAFDRLFEERATKVVVIVTFLALLELIQRRRVGVRQAGAFEPILVFLRRSPDGTRQHAEGAEKR
jgi:segregation and condensation protein A